MGGAFNSGCPGVTDAFPSVFWYADALGTLAQHGTQVVCRQTLLGGSYGLVSLGGAAARDSRPDNGVAAAAAPLAGAAALPTPSNRSRVGGKRLGSPRGVKPDFWVALLWRRLVGSRVLPLHLTTPAATATAASSALPVPPLRAYAFCAATGAAAGSAAAGRGGVVLVLINLRAEAVELDTEAMLTRFLPVPPLGMSEGGVVPSASSGCDGVPLGAPMRLGLASATARPPSSGAAAEAGVYAWDACSARCALMAPSCAAFEVTLTSIGAANESRGGDTVVRECTLYATGAADAAREPMTAHARSASEQSTIGCFVRAVDSVHSISERHEWHLNASSFYATEALLNGVPLRADLEGEVDLPPPVVAIAANALVGIGPHSVGFVVFPAASWPACDY